MSFLRNVGILLSSNLFGSLINFLAAPILARLYTPEDFGILALFLSISTIAGMTTTLKWENIIFIESNEISNIFNLTIVSILIVQLFSIVIYTVLWVKGFLITDYTWIILLTVYVASLGLYYLFRSYHSYNGNYKLLSIGYVLKILISNSFMLSLGITKFSCYDFLIYGTIVGQVFETSYLGYHIKQSDIKLNLFDISTRKLAKRFRKFPLYTLSGELVGNINSQVPIFFLNNYFNPVVTGYYSLIQRIFSIPLKLFTSSTAEAFRREAAIEFKKNGSFRKLAVKTFISLFLLGLIPFFVLLFGSDILIPIVFGNQWIDAIPYVKVMVFLFLMQFSVSPISYGLYIAEKQEVDFLWQFLLLTVCLSGLFFSLHFNKPLLSITFYVVGYSFMYFVYLFFILRFSAKNA
jgi:O-antigen/teichoic acid export membrane protein